MKTTGRTPAKGGDDKPQDMPKREFEYETPHEQPREKGKNEPRA